MIVDGQLLHVSQPRHVNYYAENNLNQIVSESFLINMCYRFKPNMTAIWLQLSSKYVLHQYSKLVFREIEVTLFISLCCRVDQQKVNFNSSEVNLVQGLNRYSREF